MIALEAARQGVVLLKNDGILPLAAGRGTRIAVIGATPKWACRPGPDRVPSCRQEVSPRSSALVVPASWGVARNLYLHPSAPVAELMKLLPDAQIEYDPGMSPAEAALMARRSDIVVAFGIRVEGEGFDSADLSLPWGQDAVIEAVAAVNPNTVVVLETGNPVVMPWIDHVRTVVEAWYPGQAGGQAIAEILTGAVNPGGRLPLTFPADLGQTPRPQLEGLGSEWGTPTTVRYHEGADVGYRWFARQHQQPRSHRGRQVGE